MSAFPASPFALVPDLHGSRTTPMLRQRAKARLGYGQSSTNSDAGFTLVEVIVSFAVFAIVATASVAAVINSTKASASSRNRVVASNLAQQDLQTARAALARSTVAPASASTTVGTTTYRVQRSVPARCPAVATPTSITKITVTTTVTWNGGSSPVVMATVLSC